MPRKRRTANPDKAPKLWIAPEWSARLHDSRSSAALSSGFSRYLALADQVLSRGPKDSLVRADHLARRERAEADENNGSHFPSDVPEARALSSEALMNAGVPKMSLPKPPKPPLYSRPRKVVMPKPRATPQLAKPRKVIFRKPPTLPR